MAKGQYLSSYQKGIVSRYYEHADARVVQKLQEIVSDLYLASDEKAAGKLWKSAEAALKQAKVDEAKVARVLASKKVTDLAALVGEIAGRK